VIVFEGLGMAGRVRLLMAVLVAACASVSALPAHAAAATNRAHGRCDFFSGGVSSLRAGWDPNPTVTGDESWFVNDQITYDGVGNPLTIVDAPANTRECFVYDYRQHLTHAWTKPGANLCEITGVQPVADTTPTTSGGTEPYDDTYTFDAYSRLTRHTDTTTHTYTYTDANHPNAPTGITNGPTLAYNPNGATTTVNGTPTYTWDPAHRLTTVTGTQTNTYTTTNQRLTRTTTATGTTTIYLPNLEITRPTTAPTPVTITRYYTLDNQPIATRTTTGVWWQCPQRQHHTTCTPPTNTSPGTPTPDRQRLTPTGTPRPGTTPTLPTTDHAYLGQPTDPTGLTYLNNRYYNPTLGVFLSVDPLDATTNQPYTYANGNPTTNSDPSGLCWFDFCDGWGDAAVDAVEAAVDQEVRFHRGVVDGTIGLVKGVGSTIAHPASAAKAVWHQLQDCNYQPGCAGSQMALGPVIRDTKAHGFAHAFGTLMPQILLFAASDGIGETAALGDTTETVGTATEAESEVLEGAVCSFDPDTRVLMADGTTKAIGDVEIGDSVEAADPSTGQDQGGRAVTALHSHQDDDLIDVTVTGRDGKLHIIHTTARHPFWEDTSHTWVPAGNLRAGQEVRTVDGRDVVIADVSDRSGESEMLNLTVSGLHTFYVKAGDAAVLVHNTCGDGFGRGGQRLSPDPAAGGSPHSTFRTDPVTGEVTHYTTWEPNPQNPLGYDPVLRYDGVGGAHFNKIGQIDVPTPHVQGPGIPGGVRPAQPWEIPWR
jgi:RHS repeat-associated protein